MLNMVFSFVLERSNPSMHEMSLRGLAGQPL